MSETTKSTQESEAVDVQSSQKNANAKGSGPVLKRSSRKWWWGGGGVVVLFLIYWGTVSYIDRVGWVFFHTGREAVVTLSKMAKAMQMRDLATVESLYAPSFKGQARTIAMGCARIHFRQAAKYPTDRLRLHNGKAIWMGLNR
jgi:hypothetical protein